MKRDIKKAIKAAGLNVADFEISSDGFESNLDNMRKANAQARKVWNELRKMGHKCSGYHTGYGLMVVNVNAYRHIGHELDFNNPASVHHY
jgi:hypothetical protein